MKIEQPLDANGNFGTYKVADIKKEFQQLLNTTNDPIAVNCSKKISFLRVLDACIARISTIGEEACCRWWK